MASEAERSCRNCKNPYCTRTTEERQNKEVQVHFQYGWECSDKEKYLEHNSGLQIIQWHNLRKDPSDLPKRYGKYWVCREQGYSPDTVSEEMQYGRAGWCADCQNDVIAWCETPKFDEQDNG